MTKANQRLVIVGAGGAGSEAAWIAAQMGGALTCIGFLDDNPSRWQTQIDGLPVLGGTVRATSVLDPKTDVLHVAIGKPTVRRRIVTTLALDGFRFATLIHPTAVIADTATLGVGVMVGPLSVVAPYAAVGDHVAINSHVGVGHHSIVGAYATLSPGVRISGYSRIGQGVFLGSNAVILPKLEIGDGATIAANSMVVRRVAPLYTVMGVPARIVSKPASSESTARS